MANFALNSLLEFLERHKIALGKGAGRAPHTVGVVWLCCNKRPQSRGHSSPWCRYLSAVTCDALKVWNMGGKKMVKGIDKGSLYSDANTSIRISAI